jgi:hypothetical protein
MMKEKTDKTKSGNYVHISRDPVLGDYDVWVTSSLKPLKGLTGHIVEPVVGHRVFKTPSGATKYFLKLKKVM